MDEDLLLVISSKLNDIQKGKGNRDGLIQQIVTYVRDGRTVTRKQWVRSEFADHAKKNEEEKKKTLLEQQEKQDKQRQKKNTEESEKKHNEDKRATKKHKNAEEELEHTGHKGREHKAGSDEYMSKLKKISEQNKKSDKDKKENDNDKEKNKDKKKDKDKHTRYGQSDQTKADNKVEQNMIRTDPGKR